MGGLVYPRVILLNAYEDGVPEEAEGFVLYVDLLESELNSRDVGQVNLSRNAYLVRINESGIYYSLCVY